MKEIFVVNKVKYKNHRFEEVLMRAFSNEADAMRYCDNFIGDCTTAEDRQMDYLHIDDFCVYKEYSRFTSEYGDITLRIRRTILD